MNIDKLRVQLKNMLAGIEAQVPFMRKCPYEMYQIVREQLHLEPVPERIYLVGCGDSWYSGMVTRLAYETWAGIPVEVMQALEFSRYYYAFAPYNALLVAISNSGQVARTVEAVRCGKKRGLKAVVGTGQLDSLLAQEGEQVFDLMYTERRPGPGTNSYLASILLHYCIALRIAEVRGRMTTAQVAEKLDQIAATAEGMAVTIAANQSVLMEMQAQFNQSDRVVVIGGGPNYGTALFYMAKILEAANVHAIGQELEEWAHEHFFGTDASTWTLVIAPPGASLNRAREQLWAVNQMGSRSVAICDSRDHETAQLAQYALFVDGCQDEILSPLTYAIPGELFALYYAASQKGSVVGIDDPHIREVNFQQIFKSEILGYDGRCIRTV